eukprot:CAMPEP_0194310464 /NCGR_PEP_ID=MMETSP0171-20130528/7420_1 /TAXON_ID=218684 /ORGANISM="Corethron pennatum, Strain L29A3" /LENGTH=257 /DNA_ID=CAMNT_0039064123 /DNA_START=38 /DNA_END=808 /DNA_ORIENTATION=-
MSKILVGSLKLALSVSARGTSCALRRNVAHRHYAAFLLPRTAPAGVPAATLRARAPPSPSTLRRALSSRSVHETMSTRPDTQPLEGLDVPAAMEALAAAEAVCFDVDSTVVTEEGIDVLAASLGVGQQVADLTASAMSGTTKFEDALAARLGLMRPSRAAVERCIADHPLAFSPGLVDLVDALRERGTHVYLVSGGFRLMIEPLAVALGVPKNRIYANTLLFDDDGAFAGFDNAEPTSADGGKPKALGIIKREGGYG